MPTIKNRILLIGAWDKRLTESGATIFPDLSHITQINDIQNYDVIGLSATAIIEKRFSQFYFKLRENNNCAQLVAIVPSGFSAQSLAELHETYSFFRVIESFQNPEVEKHLYEALEFANQKRQNEHLNHLLSEQNAQLKHLQAELEERVEKRTQSLAESRHNLHIRNLRLEGLRKALMAVYEASSLTEIERLLNDSLHGTVETSWIRIINIPQDQLFLQQIKVMPGFTFLQIPLYREHQKIGSIFFMRPPDRPFRRDDHDFLNKVSDAVSLAMHRLSKLKESESIKEQWDATFNAISEPVALIDENYEIIQGNSHLKSGTKCFESLYKRNTPCEDCQRGKNFRLETTDHRTFEVHSQSLQLEANKPSVYFHLYHDITQQLLMEKQITDSAKTSELGTVGSSIAHELNNPLGGILSFAQIIKMETDKNNPLFQDICEIESGALRCKDIVQNLLSFSRNPSSDKMSDFDLKQVCERAMKIIEIQARTHGVEIQLTENESGVSYLIHGHMNLLSQAIKNILQISLNSILQEKTLNNKFSGKIKLQLLKDKNQIVLHISDNAQTGASRNNELKQIKSTIAQILNEHTAKLELSAESSPDFWAKISFSRLVLRS